MKAGILFMILLSVLFCVAAYAQISVNCAAQRLSGAERVTCESPELIQLGKDVDKLTTEMELRLTGKNKEALVDTKGPLLVDRNACQNVSAVRDCVQTLLTHRRDALTTAMTAPDSIRAELSRYTYLDPVFFEKYGDLLVGRHIRVFGCLTLAPGAVAAARLKGTIRDCSKNSVKPVPVVFKQMDETEARFIDEKEPATHWEGTVQRQQGQLVLVRD